MPTINQLKYWESLREKSSNVLGKRWNIKDTSKMHHSAWNNHHLNKICKICKKEFTISPSKYRTKFYCSMSCCNKGKKGKPNLSLRGYKHTPEQIERNRQSHLGKPAWNKGITGVFIGEKANNWKGGICYNNGYRTIYTENGYILEQRLIAEKYLNRPLEKYEVIHHINGDKQDNRPENLYIFINQRHHAKYHHCPYQLTSNII